MAERETHVIVGAGLAGAKAAEALRDEGFEGAIVLLGSEPKAPYDRPPLSKGYLRGELPREDTLVHPRGFYRDAGIELRIGASVASIDTAGGEVALADGERIAYDRLLLATGAESRRLSIPGAQLDGLHYLRDLSDADRLAEGMRRASRIVVVGAGWIGAEVAASARQMGLEVELIERGRLPLERVLGAQVGSIYAEIHRDRGVALHADAVLDAFEGEGRVERVLLGSGRAIECDLVVVGVGVTPRTSLAEAAGLVVDNGILVDERLETSATGVFAAGDVANAIHPFYGERLRVEHWANAPRHGEIAARTMLGKPTDDVRLPYFFSDQYDIGMEYTGYATDWDEVILRGDPDAREFIAFWLSGGRVIAGMNVNVWDVAEQIAALIGSRRVVDRKLLADPAVPLKELAARPE